MPTSTLELLAANTAGKRTDDPADGIYVKEVLSLVDPGTQEILMMRIAGYSWGEIAEMRGYANSHSAEVQFGKKWKAAKARLYRSSRRGAESPERQT